MSEYPAKPQVAPQTGRKPSTGAGTVDFLQGVTTSELRMVVEFQATPMFGLLVKTTEKKIREIEVRLGADVMLSKEPQLISKLQGKISGTREFMNFFDSVAIEYKQRLVREEALNRDNR